MEDTKTDRSVKPICIVALHGFLATSDVWTAVKEEMGPSLQWYTPDLIDQRFLSHPEKGFSHVVGELKTECLTLQKNYRLLGLGYSMGGRILAQLVLESRELFEKVIFLSTDPFQLESDKIIAQQKWQRQWTQRFQTMDWNELLELWNAQDVFTGGAAPGDGLQTEELNLELVFQCFEKWSRLEQDTRLEDFNGFSNMQLVWAYGEEDKKYRSLHESWQRNGLKGEFVAVKRAGHRFPFDHPVEMVKILKTIMERQT